MSVPLLALYAMHLLLLVHAYLCPFGHQGVGLGPTPTKTVNSLEYVFHFEFIVDGTCVPNKEGKAELTEGFKEFDEF